MTEIKNEEGWRAKQVNFYLILISLAALLLGGGLYIGRVSSDNSALMKRTELLETQVSELSGNVYNMNTALTTVSTNLQWIRGIIEQDSKKK